MFSFKNNGKPVDFGKGIKATALGSGSNLNAVLWNTPAGTVSPSHRHPEEQMGYVIKGAVEVTIGNEKSALRAGDAYIIPSNISHQFTLLEDSEIIDIFSPSRPLPAPEKK